MIFLCILYFVEILCWLFFTAQPASKIFILSIPADIIVFLLCFALLICVKKKWKINYIKYFLIPLTLALPPLVLLQFPTFFLIKLCIILVAFIMGLNDYAVNKKFIKSFLYLIIVNVFLKVLLNFPHASPLHIFNTNEAILLILYLFMLLRSQRLGILDQLLTLVAILGTKSRSAFISYLLYSSSIRRISILFILALGIYILLPDMQFFRRIPLIMDDVFCLMDQCAEGSMRVNLVINALQVFTDKIWFGLTAEYHDHLGLNWGDYFVYSPHFGPLVWIWGYGVFGSLVLVMFVICLYKKTKNNSVGRSFIIIGMWVWLFNDFTMSYLFWFLLGHAFSIEERGQNDKI